MIHSIDGVLESVQDTAALVRVGEIVYEISVPAADLAALYSEVDRAVTFHTLHYLESQGQGSSFWPKLIGFRTPSDRAFFLLVTSVKGIGTRRALRALTIPFARVAEAIMMKDLALLMSLPEIGRKTAETMVIELREKVAPFAAPAVRVQAAAPATKGGGSARAATAVAAPPASTLTSSEVMDAMTVLVQLGESRLDARAMIDRALERDPELMSANTLVAAALASKGLSGNL
ncbi:MAG: hypothetical protein EXS17_04470 [Phycisphaerales bacterium]|nr:hypothetical protein [Phycisphaerales bacterium]